MALELRFEAAQAGRTRAHARRAPRAAQQQQAVSPHPRADAQAALSGVAVHASPAPCRAVPQDTVQPRLVHGGGMQAVLLEPPSAPQRAARRDALQPQEVRHLRRVEHGRPAQPRLHAGVRTAQP